jgi:hypothetical protein
VEYGEIVFDTVEDFEDVENGVCVKEIEETGDKEIEFVNVPEGLAVCDGVNEEELDCEVVSVGV